MVAPRRWGLPREARGPLALGAMVAAALFLGATLDRSVQRTSLLVDPVVSHEFQQLDARDLAPEISHSEVRAFERSDAQAPKKLRAQQKDLAIVKDVVQVGDAMAALHDEEQALHAEEHGDEEHGDAEHEEHAEAEEEEDQEMTIAACNVPPEKRPKYCELLVDLGADLASTKALLPGLGGTSYRYEDNMGGYSTPLHGIVPVRLPNSRGNDIGVNQLQFPPDHVIPAEEGHTETNLIGRHKGGPLEPVLRLGTFQEQDLPTHAHPGNEFPTERIKGLSAADSDRLVYGSGLGQYKKVGLALADSFADAKDMRKRQLVDEEGREEPNTDRFPPLADDESGDAGSKAEQRLLYGTDPFQMQRASVFGDTRTPTDQAPSRPPPPPPSRTKWTRLVHPSVLTGHAHADRPGHKGVAPLDARARGQPPRERLGRGRGRGRGAAAM
jgi:hypothetical protein